MKGCEPKYRVRSQIKGPARNSFIFSFGQVVRIMHELSSQHVRRMILQHGVRNHFSFPPLSRQAEPLQCVSPLGFVAHLLRGYSKGLLFFRRMGRRRIFEVEYVLTYNFVNENGEYIPTKLSVNSWVKLQPGKRGGHAIDAKKHSAEGGYKARILKFRWKEGSPATVEVLVQHVYMRKQFNFTSNNATWRVQLQVFVFLFHAYFKANYNAIYDYFVFI